ncbi:2-oxo-4-hydroxy-4-carboxy-5-ureidoimidazoline decarboxylase [Streptacidiphilus sp. N1-12]|uniref:2-oxo-4-hydroxy-4-carboxy-5-ureidoimidazoline decarboxylase n=2 Tax=Streptacidiphilus alkalitolerans TaxID=3342712 RepID=A0ABV6VLI0_9ACTN
MARSTTALARLNALGDADLDARLVEICSSPAWAKLLRSARPWADDDAVHSANADAMAGLGPADLADAMAGHARIGQPKAGDATSQREQSGVHGADDALLDELQQANADYEARFGHVFLICATGRTAETMLEALRGRIGNDPRTEQEIVRGELRKINDIRIDRLLNED